MLISQYKLAAVAGMSAAVIFALPACSSDTARSAPATPEATSAPAMAADPASDLVGPGCASYAEKVPSGPGSVMGMAQDPVTVAASNNPLLTTLTAALSGKLNPNVNLVDTLNGGEFTVFAPTDDAFAKIDPATIEVLKTDSAMLTNILTYHVVPGQASPAKVVGSRPSVQGAPVTVTGSGDALKVNDASVVCGGVHTANATVYLIDTVLMPPTM